MAVVLLILLVCMVPTVDSKNLNCPYAIRQLQSEVETLKSKIALLDTQVYFTATFNSIALTVGVGTVVFDKVLMNTGDAYSPTTGVFTAPRRGLYVFLVQTYANKSVTSNWDLHINSVMVLRSESLYYYSNEYVYPVVLQAGDRVSVNSRNPVHIWGPNHSFFGGWLIKAL